MAERRYVYTTHETRPSGGQLDSIESVVNEHASEGWRFVETIERDGTTVGLVFEQER
jgi:hypothetical protein